MNIGVPKEIRDNENRVAITPAGVMAVAGDGHRVLVEKGAGLGSGITDEAYFTAGAQLASRDEVYREADLIVKVKEPVAEEYQFYTPGKILFAYLHLASERELTQMLIKKRVTAIAYETIQDDKGDLPLLNPMSEVAGRMSIQVGARFLEKSQGGRGVLLGGVPGVPAADVVIIGGGVVGINAAKIAVGMGAKVTILDIDVNRLRHIDDLFKGQITTLASNSYNIEQCVKYADLLVGAVLVTGAKAPKLVTKAMVKQMKRGSVIVDVAVDQGGSVETIDRVTTHSNPVYEKYGVVHYAVSNMPGSLARTSTFALTNCTLPYLREIAAKGIPKACKENMSIARGVNTHNGLLTYKAVADSLGMEYSQLSF